MPRKLVAQEYLQDPEAWKRKHGYGQRWMVESTFSSLKRTFGEYVSAKTMRNMTNEIMLKASLYTLFIGLTTSPNARRDGKVMQEKNSSRTSRATQPLREPMTYRTVS